MNNMRAIVSELYTGALTTGKPKKSSLPGMTIEFKRMAHHMSVQIISRKDFITEKKLSLLTEAMPFPTRHVEDSRFSNGNNFIVIVHYPIQEILC